MSFSFENVAQIRSRGCTCICEVKAVHHKMHPSFAENKVLLRAVDGMMSKPGLGRYLEAGAFCWNHGRMQIRQAGQQNVCKSQPASKQKPWRNKPNVSSRI